jgi:hypothetical protein
MPIPGATLGARSLSRMFWPLRPSGAGRAGRHGRGAARPGSYHVAALRVQRTKGTARVLSPGSAKTRHGSSSPRMVDDPRAASAPDGRVAIARASACERELDWQVQHPLSMILNVLCSRSLQALGGFVVFDQKHTFRNISLRSSSSRFRCMRIRAARPWFCLAVPKRGCSKRHGNGQPVWPRLPNAFKQPLFAPANATSSGSEFRRPRAVSS